MQDHNSDETPPWFVTSLARGLEVMKAFSTRREPLSTTEVAEICGLSRAATRRFLLTLTELGYLKSSGSRYLLSVRALDLGYAYLSSNGVVELVQPVLEELTATCGETSSMAILDQGEIVYIARTPTRRMVMLRVGIGSRIPAHASSLGKAILAFLDPAECNRVVDGINFSKLTDKTITDRQELTASLSAVRRNGYATTVSELDYGVASIAVPILRPDGNVVAAINVSTSAMSFDREGLVQNFIAPLQRAKADIESAIRTLPNLTEQLAWKSV